MTTEINIIEWWSEKTGVFFSWSFVSKMERNAVNIWNTKLKKSDETNTIILHKDPQWYNQGLQLISCGLLLRKLSGFNTIKYKGILF